MARKNHRFTLAARPTGLPRPSDFAFEEEAVRELGDRYLARSIIGSEFLGRIEADAEVGGRPAIVPSISGRAWITGTRQDMLDPDDPWPAGYRLSDTWPRIAR